MPKEPRSYDDSKLSSMAEPLTIRIERLQNGQKSPVPLPSIDGDESAPGTNWSVQDVKRVEEWLVTEWAGGGLFEITVTDSSTPPLVMKWQPFWDKRTYPEKTPPPLAEAATGGTAPLVAQPTQGFPRMAAFPNGLPPGMSMQNPQPAPTGYAYPYPYPPMPPAPQPGSQSWAAWQAEQERREQASELARMRAESAQREREAIAAQHKAEIERERQATEARFTSINTTISNVVGAITDLRTLISQQAQAPKANAEIETMREQIRATEARAERERQDRDAERREAQLREMISAMNTNMQRQIEETRRISEERMRALEIASQNRGPDPLFQMFQENMRQQIEAQKELSRNQLQQMQTLQTFMMNPRDILAMAGDSSKAVDQATDRVTRVFGNIIDTQQRVTENLLQMQPGGSGAIDVVRDGLGALKDLGERYFGAKSMDARMQQQAQVQMVEAQTRAVEAQERMRQPERVHTPPQPRQEAQLAGPAIEDNGPKRLGRTDLQWFTPAVQPELAKLRDGVSAFVEAIKQDNPSTDAKGEIVGVSPDQAAQFVIMAVQMAQSRGVMIPAMVELLFQDRFADFIDVLLPDAIPEYRADATAALIKMARRAQGLPDLPQAEPALKSRKMSDEDSDDDGDEDADDEEIDAADAKPDTAPVASAKTNKQPKVAARA